MMVYVSRPLSALSVTGMKPEKKAFVAFSGALCCIGTQGWAKLAMTTE